MSAGKLVGILLIVAGIIALAYGGFTYTRRTDAANVGPIQLTVQHRQTVSVPIWAGIGIIVLGGLVFGLDRRG
jgi:multidrug transporter EmrE-like cation transporter